MWKRMMIVGFVVVMGFGPVMAMGQTTEPARSGRGTRSGQGGLVRFMLDVVGNTTAEKNDAFGLDLSSALNSSIPYDSTQGPLRLVYDSSLNVVRGHYSALCYFHFSDADGRILTDQKVYLSEEEMQVLAKAVDARLSAVLKGSASMAADQRLARSNEITPKLDDLIQKRIKLVQLFQVTGGTQPRAGDVAVQLRQALRDQIEQLDSQIVAKDARQSALAAAIDNQKSMAQKKLADDPVTAELKKVVELNEKKAAYVKGSVPTATDLAAADEAVAEARIRLAEREEEVSATGKGQLLDRLSDELAEISVDVAELKSRMAYCQHELELLNGPKDAAQLDELIKITGELVRQPNDSAMDKDLSSQIQKLSAERFGLEVSDVTVTVVPAP